MSKNFADIILEKLKGIDKYMTKLIDERNDLKFKIEELKEEIHVAHEDNKLLKQEIKNLKNNSLDDNKIEELKETTLNIFNRAQNASVGKVEDLK